jgi:hypothetical protein
LAIETGQTNFSTETKKSGGVAIYFASQLFRHLFGVGRRLFFIFKCAHLPLTATTRYVFGRDLFAKKNFPISGRHFTTVFWGGNFHEDDIVTRRRIACHQVVIRSTVK